jgi:hypothetical protein
LGFYLFDSFDHSEGYELEEIAISTEVGSNLVPHGVYFGLLHSSKIMRMSHIEGFFGVIPPASDPSFQL